MVQVCRQAVSPLAFLLLAATLTALAQTKVVVIAHRGEHLSHVENTMPAFEAAARLGADFVEADVRTTSDGKLVLMHDSRVDRTTKGSGEVAKMTYTELHDTLGVTAFDELLAYAARVNLGVYVDSKSISAKDLVDHLAAYQMTERVVVYAGPKLASEVRALEPRIRVMPEAGNAKRAQQLINDLSLRVLAFDANDFLPEVIELARNAKVAIYVDRLGKDDNPHAWQDAIDRGASGIQTDHPGELVEYLRRRGLHQ